MLKGNMKNELRFELQKIKLISQQIIIE